MSLSDLASLGSLGSGLAVLGSLIYLNIQTRQATKHQRSLMMQGRAARTMELAIRRADSQLLSCLQKVAAGGTNALSDSEVLQLFSLSEATIISLEETWLEGREGLQSKTTHDVTTRRIALMFSIPAFRAAWPHLRSTFDPDFVAVADGILRNTISVSPAALTGSYRQALAAEMATVGQPH